MKEYEKLANEYMLQPEHESAARTLLALRTGYLAGFLEAREMSEEIVTNYPQLSRIIKKLGEKEV